MQSPNNTSGGYSNQRPQQTSPSSTGTTGYVDHSGQPMGYHSVAQSAQAQRSTYGHPQDLQHLLAGDPSGLASNTPQQTGQFVNPQYPQYSASSTHAMGVSLNPGIPTHFQNYHPIEHGQPIVPSQYRAHSATPQNPYPNPAMQTRGGHAQYLDPATGMGPSPATSGHSSPSSSTSSSNPLTCDICGAPFTLPQNLKRHHESQHTTMEHVCPYCQKRFTRVDSLKRHVDRPCSQMPRAPPEGAA